MNNPLRTIRLYGVLGARFGREFKLAVQTPAEAVNALACQLDGFQEFLNDAREKFGLTFAVFVGKQNITEAQFADLSGANDIRIAPVLIGSKRAGLFNVILGAVMIIVGGVFFWAPPFGWALIYAGAALMMGGIAQMLAPMPKDPTSADKDERTSYAFQGAVNTSAQGGCVPVLYGGPMTVGSAVISAGIIALDHVHVPTQAVPPGGGGQAGGGSPAWRDLGNLRTVQQ